MKKIATLALAGCLAATIASGHMEAAGNTARTTDVGNSTYQDQMYNTNRYNAYNTNRYGTNNNDTFRARDLATTDDNDFDWGWLGLLGLIGLAGMRGRSRERDRA
ncbi:WGxxGxxG family protein [Paenibacillus xylaniclasticus]|uniref:WGxxGxxG family protein n=1 Tax=Paenibacillus xylaniclasticus TaxID=588083 RepID=UPI000FDC08CE|nr:MULTISPECIES: WGxxGxxG family protein [Paenibacillus]GFN33042.1 hypothetical protein PCURB6_33020 [Paenibacillus curdlanolyticus]